MKNPPEIVFSMNFHFLNAGTLLLLAPAFGRVVVDPGAEDDSSLRGRLHSVEARMGSSRTVPDNNHFTSLTEADPIDSGDETEFFAAAIAPGLDSCNEGGQCNREHNVGVGSCNGLGACNGREGDVGDYSCNGEYACDDGVGNIGDKSCNGRFICDGFYNSNGDIGNSMHNSVPVCDAWSSEPRTGMVCSGNGGTSGTAGAHTWGSMKTAAACTLWCATQGPGCCESRTWGSNDPGACSWKSETTITYSWRHRDSKAVICSTESSSSVFDDLGQLDIEG